MNNIKLIHKNTYRIIVEASCMNNNDEYIEYIQNDYSTPKAVENLRKEIHKLNKKLIIYRPVFAEEIRDGLDITFKGSVWSKKYPTPPEITNFIDACYKLKNHFEIRKKYKINCTLTSWLSEYIAYSFYDLYEWRLSRNGINIFKIYVPATRN